MTMIPFLRARRADRRVDATWHLCACPSPVVPDRVCALCGRPNLAAMLTHRWCDCPVPDNQLAGAASITGPILLRECRACGNNVRAVVLDS